MKRAPKRAKKPEHAIEAWKERQEEADDMESDVTQLHDAFRCAMDCETEVDFEANLIDMLDAAETIAQKIKELRKSPKE